MLFVFLWNEMTRETCQFFLEMGNKEETAVLVPGDIISRCKYGGDIVPADANMEEMAGMDALCSDNTGTLTFNKLITDKNLIEVFAKGEDETEKYHRSISVSILIKKVVQKV